MPSTRVRSKKHASCDANTDDPRARISNSSATIDSNETCQEMINLISIANSHRAPSSERLSGFTRVWLSSLVYLSRITLSSGTEERDSPSLSDRFFLSSANYFPRQEVPFPSRSRWTEVDLALPSDSRDYRRHFAALISWKWLFPGSSFHRSNYLRGSIALALRELRFSASLFLSFSPFLPLSLWPLSTAGTPRRVKRRAITSFLETANAEYRFCSHRNFKNVVCQHRRHATSDPRFRFSAVLASRAIVIYSFNHDDHSLRRTRISARTIRLK